MTNLDTGLLAYEGVSFPFGRGTPYLITNFVRGTQEWRTGDMDRPGADGRMMGRDVKSAPTHTLSLLVAGEGSNATERISSVAELIAALETAWDAPNVRSRAGVFAELTIGERTAVGRPRGYVSDDRHLWDGSALPVLTFETVSDEWFGPAVTTRLQLVPEFTGGLPVPAEVPFVLGGGTGAADYMITVEGARPTWPTFTLHGPIMNPWIDVPGVGRLVTDITLAYDQTLTLSTAPWARWTLRDGVPINGVLTGAGARLSEMAMRPGAYQIIFGGYDPSGTSWLDVTVRPAYPNLRG